MKKNILILIPILLISVFIYGVFVGTYKIFPYEELNSFKSFTLNEKIISEPPIVYETNVSELIKIKNNNDISKLRNNLIDFIWKNNGFPDSKLPTSINENIPNSYYNDFSNLKQINQLNIEMEYGVNSLAYLFIPESSNNELIIYHQGHGGNFFKGKDTIQYFLEKNYSVLAFSMPLLGMNEQPIVDISNLGKIKLTSHEHLRFLESDDFSPILFFVEPLAVSLNYLDKNYNFNHYHMIGISGGGWSVTLFSAIDERISQTYSVAGSLPIYLRSIPENRGDYEQWMPELYQIANYLDLYIMSSSGENRKFIQIFNKYDPCCFSGELFRTYENEVSDVVSKLDNGHFEIFLDDTHKNHKISENALEIIANSIKN